MSGGRAREVALVALLVPAAAGLTWSAMRAARTDAPERPAPAARAPSRERAFEVVFDRSPNPAIARAYAAAMQSARDGATEQAHARLREALAIDPWFAPAHLAAILLRPSADDETREHFARAYERRASLTDRERARLDAVEPLERVPPDPAEALRRARAALDRDPDDDTLRYALAMDQWFVGDFAASAASFRALLERDASFAGAELRLGAALALDGDADGAARAYESCARIAPGAGGCLWALARLEESEGACQDAVTTSRRALAASPESYGPHATLASALLATGAPVDAVKDVVERGVDALPQAARAAARAAWRTRLAALRGDFDEVARAAAAWQEAIAGSQDVAEHFDPVELATEALVESGRTDDARLALEAFVRAAPGWTQHAEVIDPVFEAYARLHRIGAASARDLATIRSAWLARVARPESLTPWATEREIWWIAYALPAVTADEARDALRARDALPPPIPVPARSALEDGVIGAVYRLAERPTEALPSLRRGAAACDAIEQPFLRTRARLDLGETLEALGDRANACDAYAQVLTAWGDARPRSVTASRARERRAALRCP